MATYAPPRPLHRSPLTASSNITWHPSLTHTERASLRRQRGFTIWLTGLSGSGKSTVATALEQHLLHRALAAYRLDGDNLRFGLNRALGFSAADRDENLRRVAEVARLFADACVVAVASFISPSRADRAAARRIHAEARGDEDGEGLGFVEVWIDCPIAVAEARDPKGLYKKARSGEIKEFTGVSAPYEEPESPDVHVRTDRESVEGAVAKIVTYCEDKGLLPQGLTD